ncbi:MAG: TonB-dependent receptor [Parasphingorhabdus sp.]
MVTVCRNAESKNARTSVKAFSKLAALLTGVSIAAVSASPAWAQDAPTEDEATTSSNVIVVTARFREETVQDIGGSISALDGAALEQEGISDFEDIVLRTAGLNLNDRGPNQNDVSIRGVSSSLGQGFGDTGISGPLISQFLDDVPVAQSTASQRDFNLFDFDRVEILRGPQPTFFGEGSVGGTIRYVTRTPDPSGAPVSDGVFKAGVSFTKNGETNYSVSGASTFVIVPDKFAVRGVINYRNDGGFIDNSTLGTSDINDFRSLSGRLVALIKPTDDFSIRLMAFLGRDKIGENNGVSLPLFAPASALVSNSPVDGRNEDEFELYTAKIDYDFGPVSVSSITSLYERRSSTEFLCGGCAAFGLFLPNPIAATTLLDNDDRSFTQEFRLVSDFDGPLNITAGLYYQDTEFTSENDTSAPGFGNFVVLPAGSDQLFEQNNAIESKQYSAFAEITLEATDRFRLIGGARYVNEEIVNTTTLSTLALGGGVTGLEPPFVLGNLTDFVVGAGLSNTGVFKIDTILPRAALEYDATDDVMLYASVSTGIRNGNLNPSSSAFFASGGAPALFTDIREFSDDDVLSYEIGVKSSWLNGDLTANIAGFHSTFDNPQVEAATPFVLVQNGPRLRIIGVEVETAWRMSDYVDLFFNGAFQDSSFQGNQLLSPATLGAGFPFDLREGNRAANSPRWSYSVGANLNYPIGDGPLSITGHVSYNYTGSRFSSVVNFPSSRMEPLNILNLRLGVESENWSLVGYVSNLANDVEFTSVLGSLAVANVTPNGELDFFPSDVAINRPRTIGVEATFRF